MIHAWRSPSGDGPPLPLVPCEIPEPTLADDEVLIAVEGSVFGSPERHPTPGITPGGAAVGTITATGQGATDLLGRRVVVGPDMACGECDVCRRAGTVVCPRGTTLGRTVDGTLASAVVAKARWVCELEGALAIPGPAAALVGREAAWAYALFVRASVAPGEPVILFGRDVVTRFLVQIAAAKGIRPLVAVLGDQLDGRSDDQADVWPAWIREHGGVAVVCEAASAGQALRDAAAAAGHGERPWHVFETSAAAASRRLALAVAGPQARITLLARQAVGRPAPGESLPVEAVLDADASILGVAGAHPDLLPEVAALVVRGELDIASAARVIAPEALAEAVDLPHGPDADDSRDALPRAVIMAPAGASAASTARG